MLTKKRLILKSIAATLCIVFISSELRAAPIDIPQNISSQEMILSHPQQFEAPLDHASLSDLHPGENGKFIIHIQDAHSNFSAQDNMASALRELMKKYDIRLVLSEGGYGDCTLSELRDKAKPELVDRVARSFLRSGEIHGEEYLNLTDKRPMKIIGIEDKALYEEGLKYYETLAEKREKVLGYLVKSRNAIEKLKSKLYPKTLVDYEKAGSTRQSSEWNIEEFLKLSQKEDLDLSAFTELMKLAEIKRSEDAIDFESANLEQSVLIEELYKLGAKETLETHLAKMKQMKGSKVTQFSYFEKTLSIAKDKHLDVSKFPNFMAYAEYLKKFSSLNFDALLHEFDRGEDALYKKILSDHRQQTIDNKNQTSSGGLSSIVYSLPSSSDDAFLLRAVDRFILLLQTAHQIQMTADQFALFKYNESEFSTEAMQAFLNRKLAEQGYFEDIIPYEPLLEDARKTLDQFYDSVKRRDSVFMDNMEKAMNGSKTDGGWRMADGGSDNASSQSAIRNPQSKIAFLITGGYHTPHLKELLREKGYGYAVLTPIVTTETNQKKYESLLLGKNDKPKKKVYAVSGESKAANKSLGALDDDLAKLIKKKDKNRTPMVAVNPVVGARLAEALGVTDWATKSPGHQSQVTSENLRTSNLPVWQAGSGLRTADEVAAGARLAYEKKVGSAEIDADFLRRYFKRLFMLPLWSESEVTKYIRELKIGSEVNVDGRLMTIVDLEREADQLILDKGSLRFDDVRRREMLPDFWYQGTKNTDNAARRLLLGDRRGYVDAGNLTRNRVDAESYAGGGEHHVLELDFSSDRLLAIKYFAGAYDRGFIGNEDFVSVKKPVPLRFLTPASKADLLSRLLNMSDSEWQDASEALGMSVDQARALVNTSRGENVISSSPEVELTKKLLNAISDIESSFMAAIAVDVSEPMNIENYMRWDRQLRDALISFNQESKILEISQRARPSVQKNRAYVLNTIGRARDAITEPLHSSSFSTKPAENEQIIKERFGNVFEQAKALRRITEEESQQNLPELRVKAGARLAGESGSRIAGHGSQLANPPSAIQSPPSDKPGARLAENTEHQSTSHQTPVKAEVRGQNSASEISASAGARMAAGYQDTVYTHQNFLLHKYKDLTAKRRWSELSQSEREFLNAELSKIQREEPEYAGKFLGIFSLLKIRVNPAGAFDLMRLLHPYTIDAFKNRGLTTHVYVEHESVYYALFLKKMLGELPEGGVTILNVDPHSDAWHRLKNNEPNRDGETGELTIEAVEDASWVAAAVRDGLALYVVGISPNKKNSIVYRDGKAVYLQWISHGDWQRYLANSSPLLTVDLDTFSESTYTGRGGTRSDIHHRSPETAKRFLRWFAYRLKINQVRPTGLWLAESPGYIAMKAGQDPSWADDVVKHILDNLGGLVSQRDQIGARLATSTFDLSRTRGGRVFDRYTVKTVSADEIRFQRRKIHIPEPYLGVLEYIRHGNEFELRSKTNPEVVLRIWEHADKRRTFLEFRYPKVPNKPMDQKSVEQTVRWPDNTGRGYLDIEKTDVGRQFLDMSVGLPSGYGPKRALAVRIWLMKQGQKNQGLRIKSSHLAGLGLSGDLSIPKDISSGKMLVSMYGDRVRGRRFILFQDRVKKNHYLVLESDRKGRTIDTRTGKPLSSSVLTSVDSPHVKAFFQRASRALKPSKRRLGSTSFRLGGQAFIGFSRKVSAGILKVDYVSSPSPTGTKGSARARSTRSSDHKRWVTYPTYFVAEKFLKDQPQRLAASLDDLARNPDYLVRYYDKNDQIKNNFIGVYIGRNQEYQYFKKLSDEPLERGRRVSVYRKISESNPDVLLKAQLVDDTHFTLSGFQWKAGPRKGSSVLYKGYINLAMLYEKYVSGTLLSVNSRVQEITIGREDTNEAHSIPELIFEPNGNPVIVGGKPVNPKKYDFAKMAHEEQSRLNRSGARLAGNKQEAGVRSQESDNSILASGVSTRSADEKGARLAGNKQESGVRSHETVESNLATDASMLSADGYGARLAGEVQNSSEADQEPNLLIATRNAVAEQKKRIADLEKKLQDTLGRISAIRNETEVGPGSEWRLDPKLRQLESGRDAAQAELERESLELEKIQRRLAWFEATLAKRNVAASTRSANTALGARLAGETGLLESIRQNPNQFFVAADTMRLQMLDAVYRSQAATVITNETERVAGEVFRKYGGVAIRKGTDSDEIVGLLPERSERKVLRILRRAHSKIRQLYKQERGYAKFAGNLTEAQQDLLRRHPEVFLSLEKQPFIVSGKDVEMFVAVFVRRSGEDILPAFNRILKEIGADFTGEALPILPPKLAMGAVRLKGVGSNSYDPRQVFRESESAAKDIQNLARARMSSQKGIPVGVEGLRGMRPRIIDREPERQMIHQQDLDRIQRMQSILASNAGDLRIEPKYASIDYRDLAATLSKAIQEKGGARKIWVVRHAPDSFYIFVSGSGRVRSFLIQASYEPTTEAAKKKFDEKQAEANRGHRENGNPGLHGFKTAVNEPNTNAFGDEVIQLINISLTNSFNTQLDQNPDSEEESLYRALTDAKTYVDGFTSQHTHPFSVHFTVSSMSSPDTDQMPAAGQIEVLDALSKVRRSVIERTNKSYLGVSLRAYEDHRDPGQWAKVSKELNYVKAIQGTRAWSYLEKPYRSGARLADLSFDELKQQLPVLIEQERARIERLNLKTKIVRIDIIGVVPNNNVPSLNSSSSYDNPVILSNIRELIERYEKLENVRFTLNRYPEKYGVGVTVRGIAPAVSERPQQVRSLRQEDPKNAGARLALGGNPRVGGLAGIVSDDKNSYSALLNQLNPDMGNTSKQHDLPSLSKLTKPFRYPKMIGALQVLKRRFGTESPANMLVVGPGIDGKTNTSPQMTEIFKVFKNVARYTVIDKFAQVNQAVARSVPREMTAPNIGYVVTPIQEVKDFGADQLDVIVATNSLMYVNSTELEKHDLLSRLVRALRPNGKLFIGFYDYLTLHSVKERTGIVQSIIDSDHQGLKLHIDKLIQVIGSSHGINISVGGDFADNGIIEISRLPLNRVGSDATAPESPDARLSAKTVDESAREAAKELYRGISKNIRQLNLKILKVNSRKNINRFQGSDLREQYLKIHLLAEAALSVINEKKAHYATAEGGKELIGAVTHGGALAIMDILHPLMSIRDAHDLTLIDQMTPGAIRNGITQSKKEMRRIRGVLKALSSYINDKQITKFVEVSGQVVVDLRNYFTGARLAGDPGVRTQESGVRAGEALATDPSTLSAGLLWTHVISDVLTALNGVAPASLDPNGDQSSQLEVRRNTLARMIVESRDEEGSRERMRQAYFKAYSQFFGVDVTNKNFPPALRLELKDIQRRVVRLKAERSAEQAKAKADSDAQGARLADLQSPVTSHRSPAVFSLSDLHASAAPGTLGARLGARKASPFSYALSELLTPNSILTEGARMAGSQSPDHHATSHQPTVLGEAMSEGGSRMSDAGKQEVEGGRLTSEVGARLSDGQGQRSLYLTGARLTSAQVNKADEGSRRLLARGARRIWTGVGAATFYIALTGGFAPVAFASPTQIAIGNPPTQVIDLTDYAASVTSGPAQVMDGDILGQLAKADYLAQEIQMIRLAQNFIRSAGTEYRSDITVEIRMITPTALSEAKRRMYEEMARAAERILGGEIIIRDGTSGTQFKPLPGSEKQDTHKIANMGVLSHDHLQQSVGVGVGLIEKSADASFALSHILGTTLTMRVSRVTDQFARIWSAIWHTDALDNRSLGLLQMVPAGAKVADYKPLTMRATEVAWEVITDSWEALKSLAQAA